MEIVVSSVDIVALFVDQIILSRDLDRKKSDSITPSSVFCDLRNICTVSRTWKKAVNISVKRNLSALAKLVVHRHSIDQDANKGISVRWERVSWGPIERNLKSNADLKLKPKIDRKKPLAEYQLLLGPLVGKGGISSVFEVSGIPSLCLKVCYQGQNVMGNNICKCNNMYNVLKDCTYV